MYIIKINARHGYMTDICLLFIKLSMASCFHFTIHADENQAPFRG